MIERVYTALASTIRARQIRRCVQLQYTALFALHCIVILSNNICILRLHFATDFLVVSMASLSDQQRENIQTRPSMTE